MKIENLKVQSFSIPTDQPESDGTLAWSKTTLVVVEVLSEGCKGTGYTYAHDCIVRLIEDKLADVVCGENAMNVSLLYQKMRMQIRNLGQQGLTAMAISAVDMALWDLKCRLLSCSFLEVVGSVRESIAVYGSGGFTSYSDERLTSQFQGWASEGIQMMKMKVGREPDRDLHRLSVARKAAGSDVQIFVDANGAYSHEQALRWANIYHDDFGVQWLEEPVSSDDLDGLRRIRDFSPPGINVTAGEYGFEAIYFRKMLAAGAVDVLQADATRCGGVSGYLQAATLCESFFVPLSAHTAPHIHAYLCCVTEPSVHLEYFHDHVRIEQHCFQGSLHLEEGRLRPNPESLGFGFELDESAAREMAE